MNNTQSIAIYKTKDNKIELQVYLEKDTVWLTQAQMATLFGRDTNTISEHVQNVFNERELNKSSTARKFRVVQKEGTREVARSIEHYNLDVIISVGYRVKSLHGTQFRIWATNVLRKYIVEGYVINQKRLEQESQKYLELQTHIQTLKTVVENESFLLDQSKELVRIISDYAQGLTLIDQVDEEKVQLPKKRTRRKAKQLQYNEVKKDIEQLRASLNLHELFGNEISTGLQSILRSIFQTFEKKDLYPSIEEKAVNLLYLVIKNHPFSDGNKRIGSFVFLRFLDVNKLLYRNNNTKLVEENALVAMALLIAQSDTKQKEVMVKLVVNLITKKDYE